MDRALVAYYAEEMIRLADTASLAEPLTSCLDDFSVEDAYAVAREVLRRREASGWRRAGRKIGFTNRGIWDQYGVYEPIFGYMYDQTVAWTEDQASSPGPGLSGRDESRPYVVALDGLAQPLIEPEIVFKLSAAPQPTDDPAALLDCIEWYGHGFELVQCHFPDWKFAIADTIADGGLHGRYLVGPGIQLTPESKAGLADELATFRVTLLKDGVPVREGGGELVLGSPLNAVAHLAEVLASLPDHPPLEPGELVTTGTLTDAMPVAPGERWETMIEGLPVAGMRVRFS